MTTTNPAPIAYNVTEGDTIDLGHGRAFVLRKVANDSGSISLYVRWPNRVTGVYYVQANDAVAIIR